MRHLSNRRLLAALSALVLLSSCATSPSVAPVKDGELVVPAGYQNWPKFLSAVQRPDAKQVREIYMNPTATRGTQDQGFPQGSIFVMENYAAKLDANGVPLQGPDGKLVKGELLRVFVMGKNEGWGRAVPEALRNGDWVYAAYLPNGDKTADPDMNACRGCHLPLGPARDFVHRYDEYFAGLAGSKK